MSLDVDPTSSLTERSDSELIDGTRAGAQDAYGELWRRHARAGRTVARSITSSLDPDDLVSESFARIYQAIGRGKGPTGAFRPYLFTTIRNTAAAWGRSRRETSLDTLDSLEDPDTGEASSIEALDRSLSARAFRSLPTRWQEVLWYTEIESMTPAEVAPLLGMKANSVSALAYRAREGLREAWIQAHLQAVDDDSEHAFTITRLGSYARGNLAARDTAKVEAHLDSCQRCTIVAAEAKDVGSRMALVLLPLVAGSAGAAGYTAWLQTSGHTAAAVAAMPASVTGSTVLASQLGGQVAGVGLAGAGAVGFGSGAAGSGAAGGGAAAAGGAAVGGAAAGVSGGIIAAIVVGVVAAGTAAALVVGPMVFPGAVERDTEVVAQEPAPAPAPTATSAASPGAMPTTAPSASAVPTPSPSGTAPTPTPAPSDDTASAPVTGPTDARTPGQPTPTTPPTTTPTPTPTPDPTEPTEPGDNGTNGQPTLPTVTSVDDGDGSLWPILSGTGPVGARIDILAGGTTVATTVVEGSPTTTTDRSASPPIGTWTSGAIDLGGAGTYALTVTQTLGEVVTSAPEPVSVTVSAPTLVGLVIGYFRLDEPLVVHGVPNGSIGYSIDGGATQLLTLDATGTSSPIGPTEVGPHTITVWAVDPERPDRTGPAVTTAFFDIGYRERSEALAPTEPAG